MNKNIVVLISGTGSNLKAIAKALPPNGKIAAVISNEAQAPGLLWAKKQGYNTEVIEHRRFGERAAFDQSLSTAVSTYSPDLILLAGFKRILSAAFCALYPDCIMNIHPSLLPAFPGLNTHERALAAGCKITGCTVHFVTAALDCGPIIAQAAVPIAPDDTAATLNARVLEYEHVIYPAAVKAYLAGKLTVRGNRVQNNGRVCPPAAGLWLC